MANTLDWLEKLGVEFVNVFTNIPGAYFTWHPIDGRGSKMMKILTDRAKELGVEIFLKTPAEKILKKDGQIVGMMAESESGEEIKANAKAVIIATGGFSDNPEWIKKYTGYEVGRDLFENRIPGLAGDGIRMAWEVGAAETRMTMETSSRGGPEDLGPAFLGSVGFILRQPNLIVNFLGERFVNEEITTDSGLMGDAVMKQRNRRAFTIFNKETYKYYEETGWNPIGMDNPNPRTSDLDSNIKQALDRRTDSIFVADSIEELCAKTGIDLNALQATIEKYNKACETGRDEIFHKKPRYLRPIKQPKFYAATFAISAYGSLGGIRINLKTEVLTKDHDVIPGLYAVGNDANSIYGDIYVYLLGGNTLGFAVNSGRIAGENAARFVSGK